MRQGSAGSRADPRDVGIYRKGLLIATGWPDQQVPRCCVLTRNRRGIHPHSVETIGLDWRGTGHVVIPPDS